MVARKLYSFAIDSNLAEGLKAIKERDGISESEQIRRALRQWIDERLDPIVTTQPKRQSRRTRR